MMRNRTIIALVLFVSISAVCHGKQFYLLIGTYTGSGSKGIYVYRFDTRTGKATAVSATDTAANPSYLAVAPNGKYVYAVSETSATTPGKIAAYAFNRKNGSLIPINDHASGGDHPCYVSVSSDGKWVFAANYTGGSLCAIKTRPDGGLDTTMQVIQHVGSSIDPKRQDKPHVHAVVPSPKGDRLFATDLGTDQVKVYDLNLRSDRPMQPASVPYVSITAGGGPRHLAFHANGKWAYVVEEMGGMVDVFAYDDRTLRPQQRIAAHPEGQETDHGSADIHLSPDQRFLYVSNRGQENNIAIYRVDPSSGRLTALGYRSTEGIAPRNFCIDPTGEYLLAANQKSDAIVIFKRNKKDGSLTATGDTISLPKPVCLKMIER